MNQPPQQNPAKQGLPKLLWAGIILFVVGTGPLLTVLLLARFGITSDPNPNPIGLGILSFVAFWPSIGLILAGLRTIQVRKRDAFYDAQKRGE